ncbi:protein VAC14 homolog [Plutella xylostella]|uniref:protein VAC14 homolog n=1 Tax=Plutella xylostella TaxID=51655 RepID=UPI00203223B7|nr:protein VAC14 homolog [Plutella xylostella]
MSDRDYAPLSIACVRGLCDKIYEKRKFSGAEIEKMVKDFNDAGNSSQLRRLLRVLGQDLMASTNPNVKNGALMGLSSVAVGLGKDSTLYLPELLQPIIACCSEAESRVRYQAAEALYNVLKIARGAALAQFAPLFDALARLAADPEPQVKQGAELLDRMLKDIVTESPNFEVSSIVGLLRERMYTRSAFGRQFAVSWVAVLDAQPGAALAPLLPELLDPLLNMLADPVPEIRRMCDLQLNEFLRGIKKQGSRAPLAALTATLITHAQAADELVQLTAITWLKEFVELSGPAMLSHCSGVLLAVLPCLAYADDQRRNIRETAATVNFQLTKLVGPDTLVAGAGGEGGALDLKAVVGVLVQMLHHSSVHTKVAVLDWILHLYNKLPNEMMKLSEEVFGACVGAVCEPAHDVARRALAALAELCTCHGDPESSPYYSMLLRALLRLLAADDALLEDRGAFIIRQLCVLLNAEDIYLAWAKILVEEADLGFAPTMVHQLSTILLTAAELYELRQQLRSFDKPATWRLFTALYQCWCHSPVSLLALCLLTHNYAHAHTLIATFGDLEVTVDFLTEVDQLVQLIESPIFAYLRLELLGADSGALRGALYGLLMLLPQSDAFHTLRRRLQCVPPAPAPPPAPAAAQADIDFASLLEEFKRVQHRHRQFKMADRGRARSLMDKAYP